MKITTRWMACPYTFILNVILLVAIVIPSKLYGQQDPLQRKISIHVNHVSVLQALKHIEQLASCKFSYSGSTIESKHQVSLNYNNITVEDLLRTLLAGKIGALSSSGSTILIQQPKERGSLKGRVLSSDGQPMTYVSVSLSKQYTTQTDHMGDFSLANVSIGHYTVTASYLGNTLGTVTVDISPGKPAITELRVSQDTKTLQEVIVDGTVNRRTVKKESDFVARMPLDNLENPQVYSIVPKELLQQQLAVNISQAVANAPGAVATEHDSGGLTVLTRGFRSGINARNGMESTSSRTSVDIANIERVEVIKGPSGTLFGSSISSFGGVINVVTKKPEQQTRTEVSYTAGSFHLHRLALDINSAITSDKSGLFRINAALSDDKGFLSDAYNKTLLLAPSVSYQISERLQFTIDAELLNVRKTQSWYTMASPDANFRSPKDIPLAYDQSLLSRSADTKNSATKFFAQAIYKLSDSWKSTTLMSFAGEEIDHSYQLFASWLSPTAMARSVTNYGPISQSFFGLQQNFNGTFVTGRIRHNMLLGASYRMFGSSYATKRGTVDTIDIAFTPFQPLGAQQIDQRLVESSTPIANEHTLSAYGSDVVDFTDRFSVMLSLRLDHFERSATLANSGFRQIALAPKVGLVYKLVKDRLSIFGNYMNGFQNQAPNDQPDGTRLVLDPTFAHQAEAGVKVEVLQRGLSLTASYYNINVNDAINFNAEGFALQGGKQRSRGIEFDLSANPLPGFNILAGYVYNDNRITQNIDESIQGKFATDAPQHVANTWVTYSFNGSLNGLGLGLGGNYVSKSFLFSDNQYYIPDYTSIQGTVFYNREKWRLGLKMNNLSNRHYWGLWGMPQAPRNIAANLTLRM